MHTHIVQHSRKQCEIPQRKTFTPDMSQVKNLAKKKNNEMKPKVRSSFTFKLRAILKPQPVFSVPKATRTGSGKKVTWNLDEEQVQPGETSVAEGEAWPSPDLEEARLVDTVSVEPGSYIMSPDIISEDDVTPTHECYHQRQQRMYEPIIPIHSRTINPLRAATYLSKVSHKHSSSLPNKQIDNQVSDHQRFSSLDVLDKKMDYDNHRDAPWYKEANVDWTKNRLKPGTTKPTRFDLSSWSEKNRNQSIIDDLTHFINKNPELAEPRMTFPIADDQVSIVESETSSIHTFNEHDDTDNPESLPFLYEYPVSQHHQLSYTSTLSSSVNAILPPVHTHTPRTYQDNYIILPLQTYDTTTVCEVTFSSKITLLPSNCLTEISFDTNQTLHPPTITTKESPTIYELSDRQCPPFYINTSTSLPQLNSLTKSNPRMSYKQMTQEGKNTLPRAKRPFHSPYQHLLPEDRKWGKLNSDQPLESCASESDPYLACDKSTGQMISPGLKRIPFKRGYLDKYNPPINQATPFSHIYTNCPYTPSHTTGSLKSSYSASCVRDERQNPESYICYTAHDATPAYITRESRSPYINIDMFASNEEMNRSRLEAPEYPNIDYRALPRYFTPYPLGICSECREYIYPSPCQPVRIKNKMFHPDCFKCADCYSLLHVLTYQEAQGKFYCPRDFNRHVCCYVCKQPLASYRGRESPVNIYDKYFHPQCYRCTSCNTQSKKLSFDGRWLLCLRCTQTRSQHIIKQTQVAPRPRATLITLL